jgi:hypothetical protein
MAGHGSWLDENDFIIWARKKNITKAINNIDNFFLKKIIKLIRYLGVPNFVRKNLYGDNYIGFSKTNNQTYELPFEIPMKISGGHFSFMKNKDLMISDTYHDHNNESQIFIYSLREKKIKYLNKFKCLSHINNKSYRCDLHPRIISSNEIIIDSTHEGFRGVYLIKI